MLHKVVMPKLGESVTEGTIVKWLVKVGDKVQKYDNLLEVETAKVVAEVPVTESGVIKEILFSEGSTVAVGEEICVMECAGVSSENNPRSGNSSNKVNTTVEDKINNLSCPSTKEAKLDTSKQDLDLNKGFSHSGGEEISNLASPLSYQSAVNKNGKSGRFSPVVARLIEDHNINPIFVQGTGINGRITRKDVLEHINTGKSNNIQLPNHLNLNNSTAKPAGQAGYSQEPLAEDKLLPVSAVRKAIARKMVESVSNIPHAWLTVEADVSYLVAVRNSLKDKFKQKYGFNLTFFTFFVSAVAKALQNFPILNSTWQEDGILLKKDINISVAVASEESLFVPVIRNANCKSLSEIAIEVYNFAKKAHSNTLSVADMEGGTFTVNNTGSFGSIHSAGIINYPQVAILQIESIVKRPVITKDGAIAIKDMVNLCLSIDHRVVDGLIAGNFLAHVKHNLANMQPNF